MPSAAANFVHDTADAHASSPARVDLHAISTHFSRAAIDRIRMQIRLAADAAEMTNQTPTGCAANCGNEHFEELHCLRP